jgi:hypothetical protein
VGLLIGGRQPLVPRLDAGTAGIDDPQAQSSFRAGSRASWPGSLRAVAAGIAAAAVVVVVAVLLLHDGAGQPASASSGRYGQLPSWLPKAKVPVDRIAQASPAHPWLAIEGDTVAVHLAGGRTMATAVGPAVPEEGQFPVPATTLCAFTVTFTSTSGRLPLNASAFTILDEFTRLHHPRVTVSSGGVLPRVLSAGHSVTLTISGVLPTGNGQLRWTPVGTKPIVSWDFDVEID